MKLNSHPPVAGSPSPATGEPDLAAKGADIGVQIKRQTSQIDVAANWRTIQAYLTLGLGVLATKLKRDESLRFHGYQAVIGALVVLSGHGLFTMLGGAFQGGLRTVWDLTALGSWAFLVLRAAQGRPVAIPIIAGIARRQAGGY